MDLSTREWSHAYMLFYQIRLISLAVDLQLYVQSDMLDFELASINAASVNFPGVEMKGCFYHLSSNLWKPIQRLGLKSHA